MGDAHSLAHELDEGFAFVSFPSLAGWGLAEIAFLHGLRLTAHALAMIPLMGMNDIHWLVCYARSTVPKD
ncbi:hypothetical protein ACIBI9_36150 [Nonomuraea sp. NPDC050451]|uniref:hypothetical protein n=1 Tax=Nonomuraea sp. NPDC050451 TaxID=3364364 RepID=UPI0037AA3332